MQAPTAVKQTERNSCFTANDRSCEKRRASVADHLLQLAERRKLDGYAVETVSSRYVRSCSSGERLAMAPSPYRRAVLTYARQPSGRRISRGRHEHEPHAVLSPAAPAVAGLLLRYLDPTQRVAQSGSVWRPD